MDPTVYQIYYQLERDHWWNQAKRSIIVSLLERFCAGLSRARIVDIGSGTGSIAELLESKGMNVEVHDGSPLAMEYLRKICKQSFQKNFPVDYWQIANEYDVVLLLDVLEHLEDDRRGLDAALQILKPGGILVCTVPACKSMWGEYDIIAHHCRRYSLAEMRKLLKNKPVQVEQLSYYSALLFPFLYLVRFLENSAFRWTKRNPVFRPHFVPKALNTVLRKIFDLEKRLLRHFNLPFGSAIVAVLRKPYPWSDSSRPTNLWPL